MYIKVTAEGETIWPYSLERLPIDNPNVSFPQTLTPEILAAYNVHKVVSTSQPEFDPNHQELRLGTPVLEDGEYRRTYTLVDLPDADVARQMRLKRQSLLMETDYHAMSDRTMSDEMRAYRQALRDVPSQSGFPRNITWPTKP